MPNLNRDLCFCLNGFINIDIDIEYVKNNLIRW